MNYYPYSILCIVDHASRYICVIKPISCLSVGRVEMEGPSQPGQQTLN